MPGNPQQIKRAKHGLKAEKGTDAHRSTELNSSSLSLPHRVVDIFNPNKTHAVVDNKCQCLEMQCTHDCQTLGYMSNYGWEYRTLLRESEDQEFNRSQYRSDKCPGKSPALFCLVHSGILPPLEKRARDHTPWSNPVLSKKWSLVDYMERQPKLNPSMRGVLVDWVCELSDDYNFSPAALHLAITLIDKTLACTPQFSDDKDNVNAGFIIESDMLQCLGW